jgi:hypothetical protein
MGVFSAADSVGSRAKFHRPVEGARKGVQRPFADGVSREQAPPLHAKATAIKSDCWHNVRGTTPGARTLAWGYFCRASNSGCSRLFCACGCCAVARTCTCFWDMLAQHILVVGSLPRIEADTNPLRDYNQPTSPAERLSSLRLPCQLPASAMLLSI